MNLGDGTDPSRFRILAWEPGIIIVCETCDTNIWRTKENDVSLMDLTDEARTHVCNPMRVKKVEEFNEKWKQEHGFNL